MRLSLDTALPDVAFSLDAHAADWREAVRLAGQGLVAAGFVARSYTDQMIEAVEDLGPYIVVAPGIALAHSRPSPAVFATGLSWVRLAEPVRFGSPRNDPVWLVVGLAALDETEHLNVLSTIARALSDASKIDALRTASTPAKVRAILERSSPPRA